MAVLLAARRLSGFRQRRIFVLQARAALIHNGQIGFAAAVRSIAAFMDSANTCSSVLLVSIESPRGCSESLLSALHAALRTNVVEGLEAVN